MEFLSNHEALSTWLIQYGSIALFILLTLGIIALPVPEETLLVITGVLMRKGILNIPPTLLAAYAGSICGISSSYVLGRSLGYYFIKKHGGWVGLTEQRLQQAHNWFERFGKWTLLIGYFIPGVRHFTGLSAGMTDLDYRQFALFAYVGAVIWVSLFLSIGYFFGNYCLALCENLEFTDGLIVAGSLLLIGAFVVYRIKKANL
jgi:membrane protein DedA with SNARE-associated domain